MAWPPPAMSLPAPDMVLHPASATAPMAQSIAMPCFIFLTPVNVIMELADGKARCIIRIAAPARHRWPSETGVGRSGSGQVPDPVGDADWEEAPRPAQRRERSEA